MHERASEVEGRDEPPKINKRLSSEDDDDHTARSAELVWCRKQHALALLRLLPRSEGGFALGVEWLGIALPCSPRCLGIPSDFDNSLDRVYGVETRTK
jgi:hypothetical protein